MEPLDFSFTDVPPQYDQFAPIEPFAMEFPGVASSMFGAQPTSLFDAFNDGTSSASGPSSPSQVSNSPSSVELGSPNHFESDWSFETYRAPVVGTDSLMSSLAFTAPPPALPQSNSATFNLMRSTPKDSTPSASVKRVYVKKEKSSPVVEEKKEPKKRTRKAAAASSSFSSSDSVKSDDSDECLSKRDRNKLSAAKYRKRRKMYVDTLEGQLSNLEKKVASQTETITSLMSENKVMKEQLTFFKNLLQGKIPSTGNPSTTQKAGALMFVLFSCLLLSGSVLTQQQSVPAADDPAIADFHGPNRMLLSVEEAAPAVADLKVQNTSSDAATPASDIPPLECVPATAIADALGLVHFSKQEISECSAALLEGKSISTLVPATEVEEKSSVAAAALGLESNKTASPMEVDVKSSVSFPSSDPLLTKGTAQLFTVPESRAV